MSADCMDLPAPVRLTYSIHACSSYSGQYSPQNILIDDPNDQKSRWSGGGVASANNGGSRDPAPAATSSTAVLTPSLGGPAASNNAASLNGTAGSVLAGGTLKERQWLLLKLANRSILRSITFGKFSRAHPCNVREFKVYAGLSPDMKTMSLVHWGGLKNDSTAEEVEVAWRNAEGVVIPVEYVCVEPLSAHSSNYNISIWHVALAGHQDEDLVATVSAEYHRHRQLKTNRLILKHLRQSGELAAFEALQASLTSQTPEVRLEHPLLSRFHELLVQQGDFVQAERLLHGLFNPSADCDEASRLFKDTDASGSAPSAVWERLDNDLLDSKAKPSPRGGHSMVVVSHRCNAYDVPEDEIDSPTESFLYLFGGWNGTDELSDTWRFSLSKRKWHLLSDQASAAADEFPKPHPTARSCHQMAVDTADGTIYMFGRFIDPPPASGLGVGVQAAPAVGHSLDLPHEAPGYTSGSTPSASAGLQPADFWAYSTDKRNSGWTMVSGDVRAQGGPALVFDHQMQIDPVARTLYVFGGKYHDLSTGRPQYSGLYAYSLDRKTWKCLMPDSNAMPIDDIARVSGSDVIPSRIGHSMLFDPKSRTLLIFGGQHGDTYLDDFWTYNVDTRVVERRALSTDSQGPESGFTQRAAFDQARRDFVLLSGLSRDRTPPFHTQVRNSIWMHSLTTGQWRPIETSTAVQGFGNGEEAGNNLDNLEPRPRFAHQFVYDEGSDMHYLFGGNPADATSASTRLGDFWCLRLIRPSKAEMLRRSKFLIRRCRFGEISREHGSMEALVYLQSEVAPVKSADEEAAFLACTSELLSAGVPSSSDEADDDERMSSSQCLSADVARSRITSLIAQGDWAKRIAVFTEISRFFPSSQTEPSEDLLSMATAWEGVLC